VAQGKAAERICEELREMIMDGRLVGGARVTETDLATTLKVSRTPVREALVQLHTEGLVVRLPHSATIVRTLDESEVEDAFQLRALLEGYAALRAAERVSESQIGELERLCERMEQEEGNTPAAVTAVILDNDRFHQIILEVSGNRRLVVALRAAMEIPRVYRSYHWRSDRERQRSFLYHRELIEAFRRRDALWAEAAMKSHIHAARDFLRARLREERALRPDPPAHGATSEEEGVRVGAPVQNEGRP